MLYVQEKLQIEALGRTASAQPSMRPGQAERRTDDYRPHGPTLLFSAFNKATAQVLRRCYRRHRSVQLRRLLDEIERNVPVEHRRQVGKNDIFLRQWPKREPTELQKTSFFPYLTLSPFNLPTLPPQGTIPLN